MPGEIDEAKGRAKEAIGDLTDNERLKREGTKDKAVGKAKQAADKVGDAIEDAVDEVRDRLR